MVWHLRKFTRFIEGAIQQAQRDEDEMFDAAISNLRSGISNLYVDPFMEVTQTSGPVREARLIHALDNMVLPDGTKVKRSDGQKRFHDSMILSCIEQIYKTDLMANMPSIIQRYKLTSSLKSIAAILSFRRGGKTWALAMFAIAYAVSVENSVQTLFSTGGRASELALNTMYAFLCTFEGGRWKDMVVKKTPECIYIKVREGDLRKIYALPSEPKR